MDIYPLISFKRKTPLDGINGSPVSLQEIIKETQAEQPLYIYEEDIGSAHFEIYQQLSVHRPLWIDAKPRIIEDIVDLVTAGATSIILREKHWKGKQETIKDTIDVNIFSAKDLKQENGQVLPQSALDGYVVFGLEDQDRVDYKQREWIKNQMRILPVYIYGNQQFNTWKTLPVTGIITDLQNIKEFVHD